MPRPLLFWWAEESHQVIYWLLNMSIFGTLAGLIVWLISRWKRLPRRIAHALWIVPAVRLLIPFALGSVFSLASFLPGNAVTYVPLLNREPLTMSNSVQFAVSYSPISYRDERITIVLAIAWVIWALVLLALLIFLLISHRLNRRDVKYARPLSGNVYLSDRVKGPAVYGVFRPRILIPAGMEGADLTPILAHEHAHIRRLDNLWRMLAVLICCIHWFNPFAWWMLRAFLRETELACDESVVSRLDDAGRRAYAHALVDAAEARLPLASAFGGASLKPRIARIVSFRQVTGMSLAAFLLLAAALAWALLTNAAG